MIRTVRFVGGIAGDGVKRRVRGYPKYQTIVDETDGTRRVYKYERRKHRTEYHFIEEALDGDM